jgi:hypothetical protein
VSLRREKRERRRVTAPHSWQEGDLRLEYQRVMKRRRKRRTGQRRV